MWVRIDIRGNGDYDTTQTRLYHGSDLERALQDPSAGWQNWTILGDPWIDIVISCFPPIGLPVGPYSTAVTLFVWDRTPKP